MMFFYDLACNIFLCLVAISFFCFLGAELKKEFF